MILSFLSSDIITLLFATVSGTRSFNIDLVVYLYRQKSLLVCYK